MLCINGNVDESGQICLLTLGENSSRRMKELEFGSLVEIIVLDAD
jgi:hypothetical protein